ncbi:MAG: hypothetical protein HC799_19025 [Limnothrix sp. RL_2_0]|nr:hypothetical protein [Limnothrix sp. RL_2_0]
MLPVEQINIQTRGYDQENDYRWVKVNQEGIKKIDIPLFYQFFLQAKIVGFYRDSTSFYHIGS